MGRNAAASIVLVVVGFIAQPVLAADAPIPLAELPTNLFGGVEIAVRLDVPQKRSEPRRVAWSLEAAEHRALTRGEVELAANERTATITLQFPPVKDGVILPLVFKAVVAADEAAKPIERKLWLFPESPWTDRRERLKERRITLFDPVGTTTEILTSAEVAFTETRNTAALAELAEGTIVIGEGVDLREYRDLAGVLRGRAAAGLNVLCLAPAGGVVSLVSESDAPIPTALRLARNEIIAEFDPRLDLNLRPQSDSPAVRGWLLRGEGTEPVLESSEEPAAWPWAELRFGTGRLVLCHFPVVTNWKSGPAPRFFLAQLLQSLSSSPDQPTEP